MREAELRKLLAQFQDFAAAYILDKWGSENRESTLHEIRDAYVDAYYKFVASNTCRKCGGDIDCALSSSVESCWCPTPKELERRKNMTLDDYKGTIQIPRSMFEADWTGCNDPEEQGC